MVSETVASLFDLAIIGETAAMAFYEGLANKFCREVNISKFWKNLAADEMEHLKILQDLRRSLASAQLAAPAEHEIMQLAIENSKIRVEDVLDMIKNLNDAYVLAQLWENSEIYRVFEFLTTKYIMDGAGERLVRLHLATHKKKLETFLLAFGDAELRKNILAMDGPL
jgi:rubrerythrin